jgi:hypothetical protein
MMAGCGVQQAAPAPDIGKSAPQALPFRGRLTQGNPDELPPGLAISLSNDSPVTFSYREELTHDEKHVPLADSAFNPSTYAGASLGEYGVTAFASLTIFEGDRVLGDYTAKARVAKSYSIYSEPTHREVEQAARDAVRQRIEEQVSRDRSRLADAFAGHAQARQPAPPLLESQSPGPQLPE